MLRGRACKARFFARKGTPLFDTRLPPGEGRIGSGAHRREGCGVRQTGRLCKVHRGTVGRPSRMAGDHKGDIWDHVAIDAESRLIVSVVAGERTAENVAAVVEDFKRRTGGWLMNLITNEG